MTAVAVRRAVSVLVALSLATVLPVALTGRTTASAEPAPVETGMRSFGLTPERAPQARALVAPTPDAETGADAEVAPSAPADEESWSQTVDLGGRAHVIGVTWPLGTVSGDAVVQVREARDGTWGTWQDLDTDVEEGPDAEVAKALGARGGTAPWISTADTVQARVVGDTESDGATARFDVVDASTTAADRDLTSSTAGGADAMGTMPTIYTRKQWGADESIRHAKLYYGEVKAAVVHHTVGSNDYSSSEVPSIIRGIYKFHTTGRDWGDIGYNFLVDRFGRTWEGRYGGMTKATVGAHSLGVNSQTTGVSVLGTFDTMSAPSAAVTAVSKLIAWKLGLSSIDPLASTYLDGKGTERTVIGHRDVFSTECPGAKLYAQLGTIRSKARTYQGTMLYEPSITRTSWSWGGSGATVSARANVSQKYAITVTSPCRSGALRRITGSVAAGATFRTSWDGRLADGQMAPPGRYTVTLTGANGSGVAKSARTKAWSVSVASTTSAPESLCPPRYDGADRFAVAVETARANTANSPRIVVVNGMQNAMTDALVAAPLAEHRSAALLLTKADALPDATVTEIRRRGATSATIVGGTKSVGGSVVSQLKSLGVTSVTRVTGADRYEVAANVARLVTDGAATPDVLVASGRSEAVADGLVLSGPATALERPLLLVGTTMPDATRQALRDLRVQRTVVAGGPATVPSAVVDALPSPKRIGGASRYEVSTNVASWARSVGVSRTQLLVSSGQTQALADTLSGGQLRRPVIYVKKDDVPSATESWLSKASGVEDVHVLGGTGSVTLLTGGTALQAVR